jgi:hypothetical protein
MLSRCPRLRTLLLARISFHNMDVLSVNSPLLQERLVVNRAREVDKACQLFVTSARARHLFNSEYRAYTPACCQPVSSTSLSRLAHFSRPGRGISSWSREAEAEKRFRFTHAGVPLACTSRSIDSCGQG